ncbi:Alpha/beta hydrolase family-domain-containing protein [Pisolithus marmoratus]|nr:Alpha/beta hydrolase family-domain-containing protein [Pisolithus marmoratus]
MQSYPNPPERKENITPEKHVFSLRTTFGLCVGDALKDNIPSKEDVTVQCAALRYPVSKSKEGLTLVLTHGLSSHKESYHPTIAHLLRLNATRARYVNMIKEIWSIDMPNHGESAVLNRAYLEDRQERGRKEGWDGKCTTMDFSSYLSAFLSVPQLRGHRVVGIAHSGSSTPWTHAFTLLEHAHPHPFALIFIEPVLVFPGMSSTDPRVVHSAANMRGALAKQDKWLNRAEAKRWLLGETLWSKWNDQTLDLFVVCCHLTMATTKSRTYVRSMTRKEEESSLYAHSQHTIEPAHLTHMCTALGPGGGGGVHMMWAESEEYISKSSRAAILDAASRRVQTDRVVPGSGHLVPQETPRELAEALYDVLVSHVAVAAGAMMRASL